VRNASLRNAELRDTFRAVNPFRFGQVVRQDTFCPRPGLVRTLRDCLEAGHHTVVLGERRTGKTSLILETARQIRGLHVIYAQLWAVDTVADLVNRVLQGVTSMTRAKPANLLERAARSLAQLRPVVELDPVSGLPSVTVGRGHDIPPTGLHGLFDFLGELAREQHLAVVLDEFQDIRRLDHADAVLGEMRSRIQMQTGLPCVFAGSIRHEMERIFRNPSSPFFKSFRTVEVGPIDRAAFRKFLAAGFASGKRSVPEDAWPRLFDLAQDNPSDVQQLCSALWECGEPGRTVDAAAFDAALRHIFAAERRGYEFLIRDLTATQKRCLLALARVGGAAPQSRAFLDEAGLRSASSAQRALQRLEDLEIVSGSDRDRRFFDPFFREWLRRDFGRAP
jgi:hypothetical protein